MCTYVYISMCTYVFLHIHVWGDRYIQGDLLHLIHMYIDIYICIYIYIYIYNPLKFWLKAFRLRLALGRSARWEVCACRRCKFPSPHSWDHNSLHPAYLVGAVCVCFPYPLRRLPASPTQGIRPFPQGLALFTRGLGRAAWIGARVLNPVESRANPSRDSGIPLKLKATPFLIGHNILFPGPLPSGFYIKRRS